MMNTSKRLIEIMKAEASEDRPSVDEMIQQMEFKLNKKIALLENLIRIQVIILHCSTFTPVNKLPFWLLASYNAIAERKGISMMPASPIFEKGGTHHKFKVEEIDGEQLIMVKHPKRDKSIHPDPINIGFFAGRKRKFF